MTAREPFRITNPAGKAMYVVVWFLLSSVATGIAMDRSSDPTAYYRIGGLIFDLAFILVGARVFRSSDEPVVPPRAWWRASGRPLASFVMAGIVVAATVIPLSSGELRMEPFELSAHVLFAVAVVAFYLNSGVRLLRAAA
jgi:hypothetical protein